MPRAFMCVHRIDNKGPIRMNPFNGSCNGKIEPAFDVECKSTMLSFQSSPSLLGLWLIHGFLDQAHEICQSIPSAEGSCWHAIMHRMEGDFWNSKYWYQQAGRHAVIDRIAARLQTAWTPSSFVDRCERVRESSSESSDQIAIRRVAQVEWQELFAYCWERASGELASNGPVQTSSPPIGNS